MFISRYNVSVSRYVPQEDTPHTHFWTLGRSATASGRPVHTWEAPEVQWIVQRLKIVCQGDAQVKVESPIAMLCPQRGCSVDILRFGCLDRAPPCHC
jgi:hypothetical protein